GESRRSEVHNIRARDRDGLLQADEARWTLAGGRLGGVRDCRDVRRGRVHAVDVVDAADIYHADTRGHEVLVEVDAGDLVENDVLQSARLRGHDVRDHHVLDRRHHRQDGVLVGIEHPYAV